MYAYSKLRRENANFKINTKVDSEGNPVYVADPSTGSDEPITGLLQILSEGLDSYDFLGMCVENAILAGNGTLLKIVGVFDGAQVVPAGAPIDEEDNSLRTPVEFISLQSSNRDRLTYIPANGYVIDNSFDFSSLAPEGEGGETIIVPENPVNPVNPGVPGGVSEA